jgi:hypothetical protein
MLALATQAVKLRDKSLSRQKKTIVTEHVKAQKSPFRDNEMDRGDKF